MKEPKFYKGLKALAEANKMEYIEAYKASADMMAEIMEKDGDTWKRLEPGVFLWLEDCGLKMDGATNITGVIETMNEGKHIHKNLSMIENIIECSDEDLQLFSYTDGVPAGCGNGGSRCDDEGPADAAKELMYKKYMTPDQRKAAQKKYYGYFFTIVTMLRSENYCLFIDSEGYNWSRYVLLLPSWRKMYAGELATVLEEERKRKEEEAAAQLVAEAKELLKYKADCDKIAPYMVADLSTFELHDRTGRQSGRRRNILAALRHLFPGQKFGVAYSWASRDEITISWTDGPTIKEVESACNWSIFCDSWTYFDGMTDSTSRGPMKYCDFAEKYGGGYLSGITFDRANSKEVLEECRNYAIDIMDRCGLAHDKSYIHDSAEGMKIYNNCPYLHGSSHYWYDVNYIAEVVARQLSHFVAA